jgi:tetratricopeptide (TPR) repeat protein
MIVSGASCVAPSIIEPPPTVTPTSSRFMQKGENLMLGSSKPSENASAVSSVPRQTTMSKHEKSKFQALVSMLNSPVKLQEAIDKLQNLSLIRRQKKDTQILLGMHDLVQYLVQNKLMDNVQRHLWLSAAITLICGAFKESDRSSSPEGWPEQEAFANQIQALAKNCELHSIENDDLLGAQLDVAVCLIHRGQHVEAGTLFKAIYEHCLTTRGQDDKLTLRAARGLGIMCEDQGYLEDARGLLEMVYQATKEQLGENDHKTLRLLDDLARVIMRQGQYEEAERLATLSVQGHEMLPECGPDHPNTLHSARNLANIYMYQGRYQEAESMLKRALDGFKRHLGDDDESILWTTSDLAQNHCMQQQYEEAEPLFQRVLEGMEMLKGETHPNTHLIALYLATVYDQNGRYDDAEELCERACADAEFRLGPNDLRTIQAAQYLASIRAHQGRTAEADDLLQRSLEGWRLRLEPDHPRVIWTEEKLETLRQTGTLDLGGWTPIWY